MSTSISDRSMNRTLTISGPERWARAAALLAFTLVLGACGADASDQPPVIFAQNGGTPAVPVVQGLGPDPVEPAIADTIDLRQIGYSFRADDAPVQVYEFSDFGCPFCAMFARGTFPALHDEFVTSGKVRWTYIPFVMGMFPSLLKKLPKSGSWMNALKVTFAFIEIAIAIRYFSWAEIGFTGEVVPHWFSRDLVDAFWIACSVGAGLYLLGLFRMPHDHEKMEQVGTVRTLIAIGFFAFAVYLLPGLVTGKPMGLLDGFMPPRAEMHEGWHQDLDDALAEAQITGKPVFVDFTGVVCSNCRWVETNIMPTPEVDSLLESDFILVQQWTDKDDDPKAKKYYAKYGQGGKGVPMYVVLHPDGTMVEKLVPPQFINSLTPQDFAEFLKRGRAKVTGQ